jgi:hypothetical protein
VKFLNDFHGVVDILSLPRPMSSKEWQAAVTTGGMYVCVFLCTHVLYIHIKYIYIYKYIYICIYTYIYIYIYT